MTFWVVLAEDSDGFTVPVALLETHGQIVPMIRAQRHPAEAYIAERWEVDGDMVERYRFTGDGELDS